MSKVTETMSKQEPRSGCLEEEHGEVPRFCPCGIRHTGDVNLLEGTAKVNVGTRTAEVGEKAQADNREAESNQSGAGGGRIRSSEEAPVMGVEQRGPAVAAKRKRKPVQGNSGDWVAKQYEISREEVFKAWEAVKKNHGAEGIDNETIEQFGQELEHQLYVLWSRMTSGCYFPAPVKRVEIPKGDGSKRPLGIPTVRDRIAQQIVHARLEPKVDPRFHEDSYGSRKGRSALEAVEVCKQRCFKYAWVLDVDIQKYFDTIPHDLLMEAVRKVCSEKWILLYVRRWLEAPVQHRDGTKTANTKGTPQGGVISPLLANLFLHWAFDKWMEREFPKLPFERYVDDIVVHCWTEKQARYLLTRLEKRFKEVGLALHPVKTRIVYCKQRGRPEDYPNVSFDFLGFTFRPWSVFNRKTNKKTLGFLPGASRKAKQKLRRNLKQRRMFRRTELSLGALAKQVTPVLRGWLNYYTRQRRSATYDVLWDIEQWLTRWVRKKRRWFTKRTVRLLQLVRRVNPSLFPHWAYLYKDCSSARAV